MTMACADDVASSSNRTDSSSQHSRLMALALPLAMRSIAMLSWWDTSIMVGYTDRLGPAVRMALLGGGCAKAPASDRNGHSIMGCLAPSLACSHERARWLSIRITRCSTRLVIVTDGITRAAEAGPRTGECG